MKKGQVWCISAEALNYTSISCLHIPVPGGVGLRVPEATSRLELPPDLLIEERNILLVNKLVTECVEGHLILIFFIVAYQCCAHELSEVC